MKFVRTLTTLFLIVILSVPHVSAYDATEETMFILIYPDFPNWAYLTCNEEHPFTRTESMIWDNELGLIEVDHTQGFDEQYAFIIEVPVREHALDIVYLHDNGQQFLVGHKCPIIAENGRTNIHLNAPSWGNLSN